MTMKIKKIKNIKINCYKFSIKWNPAHSLGYFSYGEREIEIGTKNNDTDEIFMIICHELMEIVTIESGVRLNRPDCDSDYLFVYDHRQHSTMMCMFSGLISQFIL